MLSIDWNKKAMCVRGRENQEETVNETITCRDQEDLSLPTPFFYFPFSANTHLSDEPFFLAAGSL
jgi:hypothetical protein